MYYLVTQDYYREGSIITEFVTRDAADKHLAIRVKDNALDFKLYEVTQEFDVQYTIDCYNKTLDTKRKTALDKLTEADKIILGLT